MISSKRVDDYIYIPYDIFVYTQILIQCKYVYMEMMTSIVDVPHAKMLTLIWLTKPFENAIDG